MKLKFLILLVFFISSSVFSFAQTNRPDSLALAKTLHELLKICSRSVNFADPNVSELGIFYKAAPYIIYRGDDKNRNWKAFANYNNADEKKGVDNICEKINQTANQDSLSYKIVKYHTERESEGTWHVLMVNYTKNGKERTTAYTFLKIGNKFGLGDVD